MKPFKLVFIAIISLALVQCESNDDDQLITPISDFQFLVEGAVVTFNGTVSEDTLSYTWEFGDGDTSTEEDPVHAYDIGEYEVSFTATGKKGTFTETKTVVILPSLEILLTGGPAKPEGKSWKLKAAFTAGIEGAGYSVNNDLRIDIGSFDNLLAAVGLGTAYDDTFTFVHDGQYIVDNKDGNSLMGLVYASFERGADIREVSYDPSNVPLANVAYTPVNGNWSINEEDFSVTSFNINTGAPEQPTFSNQIQLLTDEYFGIKEANGFVIIKDITETTMNVAMSLGVVEHPDLYTLPAIMFHLSFEAN
jgi:PKD repeat protein